MKQALRVLERSERGLAPLHGSSPPLVKTILEALRYSSSVTPPKWLRVYSQSGFILQVSQQLWVQASQSKELGQYISFTPSVVIGMAWSPQARTSHPLMSSSKEPSPQMSLQAVVLNEQQYSMDCRTAWKSSWSGEDGVTESRGMQDELAGQPVTFFRKEVGQGQLIMARQEQATSMYSIRREMSWQVFRGLQRSNQMLRLAVGALGEAEQANSLLKAYLITLGQLLLWILQLWVTIWQKDPRSKFCLFLQQQIGAEAAWATSTTLGYFILIQAANMPAQLPPKTTTAQSLQQVFFRNLMNSTQSIMASSVVRQPTFSGVIEVFWSPKGQLFPKYLCSGQTRSP